MTWCCRKKITDSKSNTMLIKYHVFMSLLSKWPRAIIARFQFDFFLSSSSLSLIRLGKLLFPSVFQLFFSTASRVTLTFYLCCCSICCANSIDVAYNDSSWVTVFICQKHNTSGAMEGCTRPSTVDGTLSIMMMTVVACKWCHRRTECTLLTALDNASALIGKIPHFWLR